MKKAPTAEEVAQIRERINSLLEQRRKIEQEMGDLDRRLSELTPITEQREHAIAPMRGSVTYMGDVISPIDVEWDAEK